MKNIQKGSTLIELLIVAAIILILSAVLIPAIHHKTQPEQEKIYCN